MLRRIVAVAAPLAAAALFVACSHDNNNDRRPVEGNPGATTNQVSGYDASDPAHYHPQSDDTKQYHPADSSSVQPK